MTGTVMRELLQLYSEKKIRAATAYQLLNQSQRWMMMRLQKRYLGRALVKVERQALDYDGKFDLSGLSTAIMDYTEAAIKMVREYEGYPLILLGEQEYEAGEFEEAGDYSDSDPRYRLNGKYLYMLPAPGTTPADWDGITGEKPYSCKGFTLTYNGSDYTDGQTFEGLPGSTDLTSKYTQHTITEIVAGDNGGQGFKTASVILNDPFSNGVTDRDKYIRVTGAGNNNGWYTIASVDTTNKIVWVQENIPSTTAGGTFEGSGAPIKTEFLDIEYLQAPTAIASGSTCDFAEDIQEIIVCLACRGLNDDMYKHGLELLQVKKTSAAATHSNIKNRRPRSSAKKFHGKEAVLNRIKIDGSRIRTS